MCYSSPVQYLIFTYLILSPALHSPLLYLLPLFSVLEAHGNFFLMRQERNEDGGFGIRDPGNGFHL